MTKFVIIGAVYGTGLSVLGFLATGAGHGTYVVLGLASAPLGILGIVVALLGLPFLWTGIFVLARRNPGGFASGMLVHYLSAAVLLTTHRFADWFGDWDYFRFVWTKSPGLLVVCFVWYLAGQVLLWMTFLAKGPSPMRDIVAK